MLREQEAEKRRGSLRLNRLHRMQLIKSRQKCMVYMIPSLYAQFAQSELDYLLAFLIIEQRTNLD